MMESHVFRFRDVAPRDLTPDSTMLHYVNLFSVELLSANPFALMDILFCIWILMKIYYRVLNIKMSSNFSVSLFPLFFVL